MRRSFLAQICCPSCNGLFEIEESQPQAEDIREGFLRCLTCHHNYPIHKGIPYLFSKNGWGISKESEMQGWVNLWQKKGMYNIPEPSADSFKLPYLGGTWTDFARMFDLTLEELNLQGHEVILDFGAGQGWAARYFAAKGCRAVAMDIVADEWWGLGRAWAIMEHAGVYFEPVLADGENLPFFPGTFDIIFLSAALHHFDKLDRVLAQIYQVLKPGGRIVAASEPAIPIWQKEQTVLPTLEETKEGIIERRPKTFQYRAALKRAGFNHIQIDTFETYRAAPAQVYQWIKKLRQAQCQAVRARYKPIMWMIYTLAMVFPSEWAAQVAFAISGGNLFIRAVKPAKI